MLGSWGGIAMISVWIEQARGVWFGVAYHGDRLVATATGADLEGAARAVRACLPRGAPYSTVEDGSEYARGMVRLLALLEAGEGQAPAFELCPDCVREPLASVARVASMIPRGFVATYGGIAASAGTEARVVGHVMATNPLYPIIPCHRVVGADLSLVGYTGSQDAPALRAKLERLRAEAQGFTQDRTLAAPLGSAGLEVYPVERVIEKAAGGGLDAGVQLPLW
jgi:methylated-DNA-[protein]-cysteine S-methyltransferase